MRPKDVHDDQAAAESFPSTISSSEFERLPAAGEVTRLLSAVQGGNEQAAERLLPLVYEELRQLAAAKMAMEKAGHTLQATALVHEAYLRLVDVECVQHWNSRRHFFCAAAEAMRRILIEMARRKQGPRQGGHLHRMELDEQDERFAAHAPSHPDLLAINEAIERLEQVAPKKAELVKLRFFAGLTMEDAAETLGISQSTAKRYWVYARAWLHRQVNG